VAYCACPKISNGNTHALVFIGLWFVAAPTNMYVGVARAGYAFMEELPIFLLIFGVLAAVALLLRFKF
jgi:hypothetical protein